MKSDQEYLDHIREEMAFIQEKTKGVSRDVFIKDPVLKRAFVRSIEIIGEAIKKLSEDYKNNRPDIEWKKMASARDRLIHGYFAIDYDIVWDIVANKIPELKQKLDPLK